MLNPERVQEMEEPSKKGKLPWETTPKTEERVPIEAIVLQLVGSIYMLGTGLAFLGAIGDGSAPLAAAGFGGLFFAVICFGAARTIILLARMEKNTRK